MAKSTTPSKFPTMGTSASSVRNASAEPSKNTKLVSKKGNSKGGFLDAATATHRKGIQERMGGSYAPQATLYQPNAQESAQTFRKVVLVPSSVGNRDFWDARARSGN
jgi:hypothetical protein